MVAGLLPTWMIQTPVTEALCVNLEIWCHLLTINDVLMFSPVNVQGRRSILMPTLGKPRKPPTV